MDKIGSLPDQARKALMTRSPSCRRLIWDWVELWIPLGLSFVELWWCSCMRASPCWRRDAAVPRTPPTFWWRTWWMCAVEHWAGGALAGLWLMANRMAMVSLEPTGSLALAFTQGTRPAEWSHPWNAPLMAASRPCWVGSFNGPFARPVPPLWAGQWLSVSRAPPMPPSRSWWQASSILWLWHQPGVAAGLPPSSAWGTWILQDQAWSS